MSAGLIPFCKQADVTLFLFQKTFTGRKTGYFIDFGGGSNPGETPQQTAAREFVEETETMFFSPDITLARRSDEQIKAQTDIVLNKLLNTQKKHPSWWSMRRQKFGQPRKDWRTFFIEVEYQPIEPLNDQWRSDISGRFKKRRELHWLAGEQLLTFYEQSPEQLWKRVRELETGPEIVRQIIGKQ